MKYGFYVAVEINDDAAAILNVRDDNGAVSLIGEVIEVALSDRPGFQSVMVDTAEIADEEGPESNGDEIVSAPPNRDTPKGRTGLSDRQVARAYREGIPVGKSASAHKPGERPGRPATLHNLRASDGEPVRTFGPRSREVLERQGIAVWDVDKGETGPKVQPKNNGQRTEPVRAGKPAVMRRRS